MVDKDLVSILEARTLVRKAREAQLAEKGQEFIDALTEQMAASAVQQAERLGQLAVEKTSYGRWQDKKPKILLASEKHIQHIRAMWTIGVARSQG